MNYMSKTECYFFPVVGTAKEPIAGWIDNVYGPTGVRILSY